MPRDMHERVTRPVTAPAGVAPVRWPGLLTSVAEQACDGHIEGTRDTQEPADAGIRGAGLDALNGQALNAAQVPERLLGEVGVQPPLPDSRAEGLPFFGDPRGVEFTGHSTNARRRLIMSQPLPACFM